jgi:branched-chain amino acid aminotransferase
MIAERMSTELESWVNGEWAPASKAAVPLWDRGFAFGDGATDSLRTMLGEPFRTEAHVRRLYETLACVGIEPPLPAAELVRLTEAVCERNAPLRGPDDDFWIVYYVSRAGAPRARPSRAAVVAIACSPIDFTEHAHAYLTGCALAVPSVRQVPPVVQSARMKTLSRLHLSLAQAEADRAVPGSIALLLDLDGNLAETVDGNVFLVRDGRLLTPTVRAAIAGVTREVTIELARARGIEVLERDLQLHDILTADEAFLTSTGYLALPVSSVNASPIGGGNVPGSLTAELMAAWRELLGFDYVAQASAHLPGVVPAA